MSKYLQVTTVAILIFICVKIIKTDDTEVLLKSGEDQYNVILSYSKLPKYGICWKNAIKNLQTGCKNLNETVQQNLAILFTNCLLKQLNFLNKTNDCDLLENSDLNEVTSSDCLTMIKSNQNVFITFTEFFTHTQSICFFIQNQVWNENTFELINESKKAQRNLIKTVDKVLYSHESLLSTNENLSSFLNNSVLQINSLFNKLNVETAFQQKALFQLYDRITSIQSYILGKFTLFYSIVFYLFTIFISYILTSTKRTYTSRSFVFLIQTLMLFTEWCIITYYSSPATSIDSEINEMSEYIHDLIWFVRKLYIYASFALLALCSYSYNDLNTLNNKLLLDIKNDHIELKNLIYEIKSKNLSMIYNDDDCSTICNGDDDDDDGTLSICSTSSTLNTTMSDCTYVPNDADDDDSRLDDFDDWLGIALSMQNSKKYNLRQRKAIDYSNTDLTKLENTVDFIRLFKR